MKKTLIALAALYVCGLAYANGKPSRDVCHTPEPKSPPTKSEPPAKSSPEPRATGECRVLACKVN